MASITVAGLGDALAFFEQVKAGLSDSTKFFARVAEFVKDTTKQRVLKKGEGPDGPWSPPWNRYSKSWAQFREEQGHHIDHVYLNYTGGMFGAMTQETSPSVLRVFFMPTPSNPIRVKSTKWIRDTTTGEMKKVRGKRKGEVLRKSNLTNAAKAFHLDKHRQFFALNSKDMDTIADRFAAYVRKLLQTPKA